MRNPWFWAFILVVLAVFGLAIWGTVNPTSANHFLEQVKMALLWVALIVGGIYTIWYIFVGPVVNFFFPKKKPTTSRH